MKTSPLLLLALLAAPAAAQRPAADRALAPDVAVYRRSPTELWVYDTRPELGVGAHEVDERTLGLIRDLGVRLVRHTMYWNQLERTATPGRYDAAALADWDARVRRAQRLGIELVVVVHGNPPGVGFAGRQDGYRRFARFMADMAARYPAVRFWELWNEMDQGFTDLFGASSPRVPLRERGRMYAEMLRLAYPAIKRANPRAWVLTGGMVDPTEFPTGIYEGGGRDFFDFMNLHTYGAPVVESFVPRGEAILRVMRAHGDAGRPLWNTEFGMDAGAAVTAWGLPHDINGEPDGEVFDRWHLQSWREPLEANQARRLYVKTLGYQFAAGNETAKDRLRREARLPRGRSPDDYGFGLTRADARTPRPAYTWLKRSDPNAPLRRVAERAVDVEVAAVPGLVPVGHRYDLDAARGRMVVRGVRVGTLEPAVVRFRRGR